MPTKKIICNLATMLALVCFVLTSVDGQTVQAQRRMPNLRLPDVQFPSGKNAVEVPFEAEGNHIVIPVSVNNSRPLRFVFDTGAPTAVLNNAAVADSLNLKIAGTRQVRGAGGSGASFEVKVAENVDFNVGGLELSHGSLSVLPRSLRGYDGVIGSPLFATTVVEIDWEKKIVRFYESATYKYSGSGAVLPLTFDEGGRPYTTASVTVSGEKAIPVKLVVDTGGAHYLLLEPASGSEIKLPEGATKTSLGIGASGEITGYTGRVKSFQLGNYSVKDVPTGFPDASSGTAGLNGRDGNLGGGVLRRFKVIYDYSRKQMIVEPNKFIDEPFGTPMPNNVATNVAQIPPAALPDYTGRYGERAITSDSGALYIQRPGGPKLKLVAVATKDEFTLEAVPAARIKFIRDEAGKVTEIQVLNRDGQWETSKKDQSKNEPISGNQPNNQSDSPSTAKVQSQPQTQQNLSTAEREVRNLEREWLDAYEKRDAEAMNRIVADEFTINFGGASQTKADIMKQLQSPPDAARPPAKFYTDNVRSQVFGDTVILTGRVTQQMERNSQIRTMESRYTDIYVKRNGRWQVVASQLSPIMQPQPRPQP